MKTKTEFTRALRMHKFILLNVIFSWRIILLVTLLLPTKYISNIYKIILHSYKIMNMKVILLVYPELSVAWQLFSLTVSVYEYKECSCSSKAGGTRDSTI